MGIPRLVDRERYRYFGRRTWRWEDSIVEYSRNLIRIGRTVFDLGQFSRPVEDFALELRNASGGDAKISEITDVDIVARTTESVAGEPNYLSIEFIFAVGHRPGSEIPSRSSTAARAKDACHRLTSEIDHQIANGRHDSETVERLVAELSKHVRNYNRFSPSHEEAPNRQDF